MFPTAAAAAAAFVAAFPLALLELPLSEGHLCVIGLISTGPLK